MLTVFDWGGGGGNPTLLGLSVQPFSQYVITL